MRKTKQFMNFAAICVPSIYFKSTAKLVLGFLFTLRFDKTNDNECETGF
jgi:hypothetical protein